MGCDIHLFTEVKIDGVWHCYNSPNIDRWYGLFAKMAGVRGDGSITQIVEPKGIPDNLGVVVALSFKEWHGDAHTPSWFNVNEIKELEDWLKSENKRMKPDKYYYPEMEWGYFFGNSYGGFDPLTPPADGVEDVRFVFWFDN